MTEAADYISGLITFRGARRYESLWPGRDRFPLLVQRFLPLVHGVVAAQIPEHPEAVERICLAVFETLARRWKRPPRRTLIAGWLIRSACFATAAERGRLGLKAKAFTSEAQQAQRVFKTLFRLKTRYSNATILRYLTGESSDRITTYISSRRFEKWSAKGAAKLAKKAKLTPTELSAVFAGVSREVPEAITNSVIASAAQFTPAKPRADLVPFIVRNWRWVRIGTWVRRMAIGTASAIGVIVILIAVGAALWRNGFLMPRILANQQRNMVKEFPELAIPARAWPVTATDRAHAFSKFPMTSDELYSLTNIWPATIHMSPQQWRAVQPAHVPPVPQEGGHFQLRNPKASRSGLAGVLGIDFHWSEGRLDFAGKTFHNVGVRFRGNGTYVNSLWGNKQSYKVDLNRHKKGQDLAGVSTLNFVNSIPDFSYLKDALGQKIFRELGAPGPRTAFAYVSIDVPGKSPNYPLGLYVLIEDIDGDYAKDRFGKKSVPIFKPVTYDLFGDLGSDWEAYAPIYDLKTKATTEQRARVIEFAKFVSHASDDEFAKRLPEFLDLEEYAAFLAGHVLLSSYDGYLSNGQNFYIYLDPKSNRFGFIPWDQDHGWGEFGYVGKAAQRENASIWEPWTYDNKFLKRVIKVEAFKKIYRRKLEDALAGPFAVERLNHEIDALAAVIRPAVAAESAFRLKRFDLAVSDKIADGPRDANGGWQNAEGPKAPVHQLKRFVQARIESVRDQLDGKREGDHLRGFN
jgi:hypothetical protein